jgi:type I restriction enzyme S subunit
MSTRYVLYWLRASEGDLAAHATGSTFSAVSGVQVRSHAVPVAPADEQRWIVAAIEEEFSRMDAASGQLVDAARRCSALRRAIRMVPLAVGPIRPLAEVAHVTSGQTPRNLDTATSGPIPFYKVGDMNTAVGRWMGPAREYVTAQSAAAVKLRLHPAGSVAFPKRGGAIATNKKRMLRSPAAFDLNTMVLVPTNALDPDYLYCFVDTLDLASLADGSNVPQINHGDLAPVAMPVPELHDQRAIAARYLADMEAVDRLEHSITAAQTRSAALRRAILDRAFRGELVPQDPSDEPASALLERIRAERAAAGPPRGRRRLGSAP